MSINVFTFSGNCGADLEVRTTQNGKTIGSVNVPCKSGWGENEKTTWIQCKILGDRATKLQPYLTKGSLVTVSGRLELDQWEYEGKQHSRVVCVVNDIQLAPKNEGSHNTKNEQSGGQSQRGNDQSQTNSRQESGSGGGMSDFDDDIPFNRLGPEAFV